MNVTDGRKKVTERKERGDVFVVVDASRKESDMNEGGRDSNALVLVLDATL